MSYLIYNDDVMAGLAKIESESVQCVCTSPPFWGLRDYGTAFWQGGYENCKHESEKTIKREFHQTGATGRGSPTTIIHSSEIPQGSCVKCGAIRIDNQIGLEKTPELYIAKMVEVFTEVKRVLRKDGTLWLNLGDSYVSGKSRYSSKQQTISGKDRGDNFQGKPDQYYHEYLKDKDLCMIPARVAIALQQSGWWLRQDIIWSKSNPMPESVRDRCTKSHEYIFLLTKSGRYYYDADAIREDYKRLWDENNGGSIKTGRMVQAGGAMGDMSSHPKGYPMPEFSGANRKSVWEITTQPYSGAHFATFPEEIPTLCIKAGSKRGDTVLDPFAGSGTTGEVALRLDRNFIGIELNKKYIDELIIPRLENINPLFKNEVV